MKIKLLFCLFTVCYLAGCNVLSAQTNASSIRTGVTFQWNDTQTNSNQPATIKSVTINSVVYDHYGLPASYELTQLGPNGHSSNQIRKNGATIETTSASATWNASALASFQDLNLNHYFESSSNGRNICNNYTSEQTTDSQRQTLTYGTGIFASSSGVIAITERNANNCYHVELFGIPAGGGPVQSLGETFVKETTTQWGFGGTGSSGSMGTPGTVKPPASGTDYWLSDRVLENKGTIGIALFYLDDIAPKGSIITKAQLTASTSDHADGKLFIFTLPDQDKDGFSNIDDLDDDNDGILDVDECSDLGKLPLLNPDFEVTDILALDGGPTDVTPTTGLWKGDAINIANWKSSDVTNNHLEIWHNSQTASNDSGGRAFSGSQWAEVNATTNDGLYQDIATTPGDVLRWSFAHRKRTGYAGSALQDVVRLLIGDPSGTLSSMGDFSSAGDSSWTEHSGIYVVPAGQTTTRLTFTAISVAAGGSATTSGNFVDKVQLYVLPNCEDTDGDGLPDYLDIDSDNDGIPDNVEAQPTVGYIAPSGMGYGILDTDQNGVDDNYGIGFTSLVDTDGDGIPDFRDSDSDNDGLLDIEENGMADAIVSFSDFDNDGLDDIFEGSSTDDSIDVNDDINIPAESVLPDTDNDRLLPGGDLDYRDYFNVNPPDSATIDFDGVDDYLSSSLNLSGYDQATVMAWFRIDPTFSSLGTVISQGTFEIQVNSSKIPVVKLNGSSVTLPVSATLVANRWAHIAVVFDKTEATNKLKIYFNGNLLGTANDAGLASSISASSSAFTIGKKSSSDTAYFNGDIDEVRVFNSAVTISQLHKMINQEIVNISGIVSGAVISKSISDDTTSLTIPWTNLQAYYPMTSILNSTTTDYSSNGYTAQLNYIKTIQKQTAPMPFVTKSDGDWHDTATWLHGNAWDIANVSNTNISNIVKVSNDISASSTINTLGLIIDSGGKLSMQGDNLIQNTWYLKLHGTLDLFEDSQLIQTINSDLVTSASGKLLRRQEGTSNKYRYNYWSSPVGALGATSLTNNNAATNNNNNSAFKLNMLKDGTGTNFQFTPAYDEIGKISTYWLYTYKNGLTYWDWAAITPSTNLAPGVGYTQKGTGSVETQQQYLFEGKPNNGTILINVTDKGGNGSVTSVSKTEYLLGNPYPSALDVYKFIDDNAGIIDGTLQVWQQWAGNSHNLTEYQGGYAQVNKTGSCKAYQFVGLEGETNGVLSGTLLPTRYLPVGQGFITEIIKSGTVVFKNSQRVFIKEVDAMGDHNTGSTFFKSTTSKSKNTAALEETGTNQMQKMRLEFNAIVGPQTRREVLLGFSELTTDGYDYGYDAECDENSNNDLNLNLEGKNMNIQAYSPITSDKVIPLNFKSSGNNTFEIKATEFINMSENQEIYLRDHVTDMYFDLRQQTAYRFTATQGKFNGRFEIVFQSKQQSLSAEESQVSENFIYYQNTDNVLYGKKLNASIDKLSIVNMRGQIIQEFNNVSQETLSNGLQINKVASGVYMAWFKAETGQVFTKKIIVN
ncbi:LamG-like jellyroll fold domain-containing protein [Mariniflexile sp.]|uniref:LamG-like jellyroll fold domain-containing protein n=1 Tax=Mariniflexile sp. TaxID=1979402 RepID=UPI003565D9A9